MRTVDNHHWYSKLTDIFVEKRMSPSNVFSFKTKKKQVQFASDRQLIKMCNPPPICSTPSTPIWTTWKMRVNYAVLYINCTDWGCCCCISMGWHKKKAYHIDDGDNHCLSVYNSPIYKTFLWNQYLYILVQATNQYMSNAVRVIFSLDPTSLKNHDLINRVM